MTDVDAMTQDFCLCGRFVEHRGRSIHPLCSQCHRRIENCSCLPMPAIWEKGRWILSTQEYAALKALLAKEDADAPSSAAAGR